MTGSHAGSLGKSFSLVSASNSQVEVQALKKAEDSSEIVVRLREFTGSPAKSVKLKFASAVLSAREIDGQERTLGSAPISGGALVATVPGFSLKSYAVKLASTHSDASSATSKPLSLPFNRDVVSTKRQPWRRSVLWRQGSSCRAASFKSERG